MRWPTTEPKDPLTTTAFVFLVVPKLTAPLGGLAVHRSPSRLLLVHRVSVFRLLRPNHRLSPRFRTIKLNVVKQDLTLLDDRAVTARGRRYPRCSSTLFGGLVASAIYPEPWEKL